MTPIDDVIATYLTACEVEGKTAQTVKSYRASLADFRRVGTNVGLPAAAEAYTVAHVYAFLDDLRKRGARPAYQHRRHREVKAFFSWCRRMSYVEENVFARVPLVKLEQQIIEPFSQAEVQRLLDSQDRATYLGCRNYALFLFLLDTGVRVSECVAVELDDVDFAEGRVRVLHGKGKKQRWVRIGALTAKALRDYLERYRGPSLGAVVPVAQRSRRSPQRAQRDDAAGGRARGPAQGASASVSTHIRHLGDPVPGARDRRADLIGALVADHGSALRAHVFVGASGQGTFGLQPGGTAHERVNVEAKPDGSVLSDFRPRLGHRALGASTWPIPNLTTGREQLGKRGERVVVV